MDTPTPPQTVQTPEPQAQPIPPVLPVQPVQPAKKNNALLIIVIVVLVLVLAGLVAWVVVGQTAKPQPTASLPLPTELPMPTTNPIQLVNPIASPSPTTKVSPTVIASPSAKPTMIPNPDGNTFTSDKMGISFYYANKTPADSTGTVKVQESGSIVYVYISSGKPESGQSIERFPKSTTDTLSQAISKKFLTGIPTTDCFVKLDTVKPKPTVTKATISYPIPADADLPNWEYGQKCPEKYKESNGMAYFFEDSNYPDRFYYVSIGQYIIPSSNSKPDSKWQDTIVVF